MKTSALRALVLVAILAAHGEHGCGGRLVSDFDLGEDGSALPDSDAGAVDSFQDDSASEAGATDSRGPVGCIGVAVRLGPAVICDPSDPGRDCRGILCVDLFHVNAPTSAPLARSCRGKVDLGEGQHASLSLIFSAAAAPPQSTLLVGAFLAEEATSAPAGPAKGDPALSVAAVSYSSATHCPWLDLVLDKRW